MRNGCPFFMKKGRPGSRQSYWSSTGVQTFSVKDQRVNISGHLGCTVSVMTAQLCPSSVKADMDNVYTSVPECLNKTLLQKQTGGQMWPSDYSLLGVPGGSVVKNPPAGDTADRGSIPGSGRSPGVEMATRSSILPWKIPWTEEPGGLQSTGLQSRTWLSTQRHMHAIVANSWSSTNKTKRIFNLGKFQWGPLRNSHYEKKKQSLTWNLQKLKQNEIPT